ncbi:methionine--tRNA ligase [Iamia sp.]|uniref:methionine--tRNA ligase n=1 Tax=Iamia sp. TaxID=2722710 RepID=UPI002B83F070|nr:methionine--tRNA ligase [Iamia sp.]HXH55893.1 methionine--tRNA ligase [Iamia sp.]
MPGRFYVTTPIYYVNDAPHLGHAYSTITADALARWHRLVGDEVRFLTGTDEHGLKIQRVADERGITPIEQADWASARFGEAWALLDVEPDDFLRTSEPRHHAATQALLQKVYDAGHIYSATYSGWYCVSCEAYYTPDDLLADPAGGEVGLCPIHERPVEQLTEENWFFRLSAFTERLEAWLTSDPSPVRPAGKRNEALGVVRGGLQDISITRRSLTWGVPVPWDAAQVFYVWFDALINYATSIGYGTDPEQFDRWWPHVHHIIGKDIIRFHCVYWPAMLMAAGEDPPHQLDVHGFLLVGGAKMSKTAANKVAPVQLVGGDPEHDFPALGVDGLRHHFLHDQRFGPDGDLSVEGMVVRYNTDLANNLGNLLARVSTVVAKQCNGTGPAPRPDSPLAAIAAEVVVATSAAWSAVAPSEALDATWRLLRETNSLLEEAEPWKVDPGPDVDGVLGDALEVLRIVAILASPALTRAPTEIWRRIGLTGDPAACRVPDDVAWGGYPGGLPVEKGTPLFPRLKVPD